MSVHINLREYQLDLIDKLRQSLRNKNKRIILCAPTGAGKTVMFSYMVSEHHKKGGKILIFTHRKELLKQAGSSFEDFGLIPKYIKQGEYPDLNDSLHVAMVETFYNRSGEYEDFLNSRTMIIIDEAHLQPFNKIFPFIHIETVVIGATATPYRKGKQDCLSNFYTDLIQGVDTPDLLDLGFLSKAVTYGVDADLKGIKKSGDDYDMSKYYEENKTYEGVIHNYKKYTLNKKTLLFSSNIESSKRVCREFLINGFEAKHIDGKTPTKERDDILDWFDNTPNAILCNCSVLTTGFNQKDIDVIILYRATTSLPLFLQMCGRGSRTTDNKKQFTILDFGSNVTRLGHWQDNRVWSLKKKIHKEGAEPQKDCPNCGARLKAREMICTFCGHVFVAKEKEENPFAELQLLEPKMVNKKALRMSVYQQAQLCKAKLVKAHFLLHNYKDIEDARYFCELMGYKKGFEFMNKNQFKVFQQ